MGCREPNLHVSVSLVDLVALSLISGQRAAELFRREIKIGFDPIHENQPWIAGVSLELKKPCHLLRGKECSAYPGRPIACALFPEYCFIVEPPELILQILESGRTPFPHHRLEKIISQRLGEGGHLDGWEARIRKLDQAEGLEGLIKMKRWTDQIAMASDGFSLSIVYQFDKNRLHPICLCK